MSWAQASSNTRVRSREDILYGRNPKVEIVVNPHHQDVTVVEMDVQTARALARVLQRHVRFLDPPRKTRRRS